MFDMASILGGLSTLLSKNPSDVTGVKPGFLEGASLTDMIKFFAESPTKLDSVGNKEFNFGNMVSQLLGPSAAAQKAPASKEANSRYAGFPRIMQLILGGRDKARKPSSNTAATDHSAAIAQILSQPNPDINELVRLLSSGGK